MDDSRSRNSARYPDQMNAHLSMKPQLRHGRTMSLRKLRVNVLSDLDIIPIGNIAKIY